MASNTLTTLIKIHKQHTDILRREMALLEAEAHQLHLLIKRLQTELEQEITLVIDEPVFSSFFGAYSSHTQEKIERMRHEIIRLQTLIEEKRDQVLKEFSEQKKYEIAQAHMRNGMVEAEQKETQNLYDDIATQRFIHGTES